MSVFLSILRGINVSGQRKVPMAQLKALYETLGFKEVNTYIQSGNVVFRHSSGKGLAEKIEAAIQKEFGFDVPVIVRTAKEMEAIVQGNPFLKKEDADEAKLHVTFLAEKPEAAQLKQLATYDYPPDRYAVQDQEIYLHIPGGYGHTKLSNAFFESRLKVKATTRNWKTVRTLAGMMGV